MTSRLLEDQSLDVLARHGLRVPPYVTIDSPSAAEEAYETIGGPCIAKALVPVGGRQKGGMVVQAHSPGALEEVAQRLLGQEFRNFAVDRLLIAAAISIRTEFFLSILYDSRNCGPVVFFSKAGGVDVEQKLQEDPELLHRQAVDVRAGVTREQALALVRASSFDPVGTEDLADAIVCAYRAFWESDARLVEVNPLVVTTDGDVCAASAVMDIDQQAAFRLGPDLISQAPANNGYRPLTSLEQEIRSIDEANTREGAIRFNEFDEGDLGLMITGGGAGLVALDAMERAGGRAATSFDIKTGDIEEKIYGATRAVLRRPNLRGLVVGANFSNFAGIDMKARGVARAIADEGVDCRLFPVVIRLCGPNQEVARDLISAIPGAVYLDEYSTIEDAVDRLLELAGPSA